MTHPSTAPARRPAFRTALALVPAAALLLAGCDSMPDHVVITGGETIGQAAAPRVVPARFSYDDLDGNTVWLEMLGGDGTPFTGRLARAVLPGISPLPGNPPLRGGEPYLHGTIADTADATRVLHCSFVLLNPARLEDGGGNGRCEGSDRRVEFIF